MRERQRERDRDRETKRQRQRLRDSKAMVPPSHPHHLTRSDATVERAAATIDTRDEHVLRRTINPRGN